MVKQHADTYIVKRRNKKILITKDDLKAKNLALTIEYKTADANRRGEILSEYYDFNKPFINYFPQFHGTYRDEIINIFITMIPRAFKEFEPARGVDINSYLSMFYKKHAVREFLYLHTTVQYNRFTKDEHGRSMVEKAHVVSLDLWGGSGSGHGGSPASGDDTGDNDGFKADEVTDYHLRLNSSNLEETHENMASMVHHFEGQPAEIVADFESGLRWHEVMQKSGLTTDKFLSTMMAIRMQLQRMMKKDGRDVRFITKPERSVRRAQAAAKPRRPARKVPGVGSGAEVPGDRLPEDWGAVDGDGRSVESSGDQASRVLESLWNPDDDSQGWE